MVQFTIIYPPAAAATEIANSAPVALRPAWVEEHSHTYRAQQQQAAVLAQLHLLWGPFFWGKKVPNHDGEESGRAKKDS